MKRFKLYLLAVAGVCSAAVALGLYAGCHRNQAAARRAFAKLEAQTHVNALLRWGGEIIHSTNPEREFERRGNAIPSTILKSSDGDRPVATLTQLGDEWFVLIDSRFGVEFYGVAIGRTNALFPNKYRVWVLRPGLYYFQTGM